MGKNEFLCRALLQAEQSGLFESLCGHSCLRVYISTKPCIYITPGTERHPEGTANRMFAICHTLKNYPQSFSVIYGFRSVRGFGAYINCLQLYILPLSSHTETSPTTPRAQLIPSQALISSSKDGHAALTLISELIHFIAVKERHRQRLHLCFPNILSHVTCQHILIKKSAHMDLASFRWRRFLCVLIVSGSVIAAMLLNNVGIAPFSCSSLAKKMDLMAKVKEGLFNSKLILINIFWGVFFVRLFCY